MAYTETASEFFQRLGGDLPAFQSVGGVFQFEIEGEAGGTWAVDLDNGTIQAGDVDSHGKTAQALIRARERDFMALVEGRMSAQDGLLTERLHVAGDVGQLVKMIDTFEQLRSA
tara:strand:- start:459 stop:800 length:342 start_codon:yes stop_codon:yes gene_type:complete